MCLTALRRLDECFYDPLVLWGAPLALALMGGGTRCELGVTADANACGAVTAPLRLDWNIVQGNREDLRYLPAEQPRA